MVFKHRGLEFTNDPQKEVYKEPRNVTATEIKNRYFLLFAKCTKCDKKFRMKVLKSDFSNTVFCPHCNLKGIRNYEFKLLKKEYSKTQFLNLLNKDDVNVIQDEQN